MGNAAAVVQRSNDWRVQPRPEPETELACRNAALRELRALGWFIVTPEGRDG